MSMRAPLVALLLVLPVVGLAAAGTTAVTEISNATANEAHFMKAFDAPATALADFDGDGRAELVAHNDNQYVYVLSTTQPRVLAEYRTDYPSGWGVRPINDPAVADVDNDGRLDIVAVNSAGVVCVHEYAGGTSATSMTFERRWCKRMDMYGTTGADAGAWVEDVNGDGKKEIFSQTEESGLFAFNWDGGIRWSKNTWGGNSGPLVTDLDGDGRKEAIFFGDGGEVKAFDASSGSQKWAFHANAHVRPASIPVAGNAADLDGDGRKEVVFAARDAPWDDTYYHDNHLMIFVLGHNGGLKAKWQPPWGNPLSYTHPVLLDVDGDGRRDILLQDWNTIGHKPGNWEKLGPANVFAYRVDGSLIWRTQIDNSWSNDDLGVGDLDGDGRLEVMAVGFGPGGDGVWYLDLRTGAKETHVPVGSGWTILRGPVLGDFDGSGKLSWAISVHSSTRGGAYKVFRTDAACTGHGFYGWQNRYECGDGSTPPPDTTPPPPSGDFTATFSTNGGNEWWIAVKVQASHSLAGVDARINGGSWRPLTLQSWGDWAASHHAPSGSVVEFRARGTSGGEAVSGAYSWPSGAPTSGGTTPPPSGGGLSASFSTNGGNNWWVAVRVSANQPLAGVDARVNGGSWKALTFRSWGEWTGSFYVPTGSVVEFRARGSNGGEVVSGGYAWPSGTPTSGGGTTPPPEPGTGSFAATFKNARGNVWWVEVDVSATGGTLAGVDARVNGGGWIAMGKTSWGSWAKSLSAPSGSSVEFRARSAEGDAAQSAPYRWPPA